MSSNEDKEYKITPEEYKKLWVERLRLKKSKKFSGQEAWDLIMKHPLDLAYVEDMTISQAYDAVRRNGSAIRFVPDHLREEFVCLAAVENNPEVLKYIHQDQQTAQVCLAAIQKNREMLRYVSTYGMDAIEKFSQTSDSSSEKKSHQE